MTDPVTCTRCQRSVVYWTEDENRFLICALCARTEPTVRTFRLVRDVDVSGISGTGLVAFGAMFPDGVAVTRWNGIGAQTCVWASIHDIIAVHGHSGATRIVWDDEDGR